jgi:hypothetical protein
MRLRGVGLVSVFLACSLLRVEAWAGSASIVVGTATGVPGERVRVAVTLHTDDTGVYSAQNDLLFDGPGGFAASSDGASADCELGPDLAPGEVGGSFRFGDTPCAAPYGCRQVLPTVVGQSAQIPDGTTLYTCAIDIAPAAAPGSYDVFCAYGSVASRNAIDGALPTSCTDGTVVVVDGPAPTPTPSTVAAPTSTPTATAVHLPGETPAIELSRMSGDPGETVVLTARLVGVGDAMISGVQADITFDPDVAVAERDGDPDCTPGTSPNLAGFSAFGFLHRSCDVDGQCTRMRAIIIPADLLTIPDGAVLFTCAINIASDAHSGTYPLTISKVLGSDRVGHALRVGGRSGAVTVGLTSAGSVANNPSMSGGCGVVGGTTTSPVSLLAIAAALLLVRRQRRTSWLRGRRAGLGRTAPEKIRVGRRRARRSD